MVAKKVITLIGLLFAWAAALSAQRQKINFNADWRLCVGDEVKASEPKHNDSEWQHVTLPYSFNGDEAFRKECDELWSDVKDVLATGIKMGSEIFRALYGKQEIPQEEPLLVSVGDYDYLFNEKTATIVKYTGHADTIMVPSSINEYQVTVMMVSRSDGEC